MHKRIFFLLLLAFSSCRSPNRSNGTTENFAQFFISEVRARGGRTLQVEPLPVIKGRWRVERDEFGFQIHIFSVEFELVDSFMTNVLGAPKITVQENLDGYPQRMYDSKISGMHIQLARKKGEISVVAVGPRKGIPKKD
ncbi:MAG: hypothetical protein JWM99_72 [Verrucomicrobiales bacterium]|nr:hypothetical protein [Verrucomicrobiales bacterium]